MEIVFNFSKDIFSKWKNFIKFYKDSNNYIIIKINVIDIILLYNYTIICYYITIIALLYYNYIIAI